MRPSYDRVGTASGPNMYCERGRVKGVWKGGRKVGNYGNRKVNRGKYHRFYKIIIERMTRDKTIFRQH